MKTSYLYTLLAVVFLWSCSSMQNMNTSIEDDIYYVPDKKPLMVKEVETITGEKIDMTAPATRSNYAESYPESGSSVVINRQKGRAEKISTSELAAQAENILNDPYAPETTTLYENTGYWIGGFKGSNTDLREAARIINQYPEGFGFISNGPDIALNLSFSPEWNVYTDNGRYWWFPSSSNIRLYNTFLFGTYPKYIWTVVWNEPFYDSWAFDAHFNFGWGGPGWSFGFGWNSAFYPPRYGSWYGYYPYWGSWYDPWWGPSWYPGWHHSHWHHHWYHPNWNYPNWGGHYPGWTPPSSNRPNRPGNPRPNLGSGSIGLRPGINRPGSSARPNYNNQRPGSSVRPGSGSTRPDNNAITRPGTTRPNYNNGRPGTTTPRPNYNTTRPSTTRPANSNSRPTTTTRPGSNSNTNRYTRPATRPNTSTNRNNNVKNYNRQPNNYRPTYNNNRSYNRSNNSNRSSYTAPRISSPSRSGGTHVTPSRSTNRSGGRR